VNLIVKCRLCGERHDAEQPHRCASYVVEAEPDKLRALIARCDDYLKKYGDSVPPPDGVRQLRAMLCGLLDVIEGE
jgi:hypothetical protein